MKNSQKMFHKESFVFCFHCLFPSQQGQESIFSVFSVSSFEMGKLKLKVYHGEVRWEKTYIFTCY